MLRHLFNLITLVSVLIGLVVATTWVRSYCRVDELGGIQNAGATRWTLRSMNGEFLLIVYRNLSSSDASPPPTFTLTAKVWRIEELHPISIEPRRGIGAIGDLITLPIRHQGIWIGLAHWIVLLLCLPLPLIWAIGWRRRVRRRREGLCPGCSYDLRATPDRCPECGAVPSRNSAAPL